MRLIRSLASVIVLAQLVLGGRISAQSCEHAVASGAAVQHQTQPAHDHGSAPDKSGSSRCDQSMMLACNASTACGLMSAERCLTTAGAVYENGVVPGGDLLASVEHVQRLEPPPPRI
jgi:hypothetical protein